MGPQTQSWLQFQQQPRQQQQQQQQVQRLQQKRYDGASRLDDSTDQRTRTHISPTLAWVAFSAEGTQRPHLLRVLTMEHKKRDPSYLRSRSGSFSGATIQGG